MNNQYYPTPQHVIEKMLSPWLTERYGLDKKTILEPSAGKGHIIDFIKNHFRFKESKYNIYAYEINPEFQLILRTTGVNVIGSDFLNDSTYYDFDLIIMNPPFNNGVEHLLKAWEILKNGDIVCLLNKETVDNPYSKSRQLLKSIIDNNGSVEYLGNCFSNSENKTDVEVIMVRLHKKTIIKNHFDDIEFDTDKSNYTFKDYDTSSPAVFDTLTSFENAHRVGIIAFQELMNAYDKFNLTMNVFDGAINSDVAKSIESAFKNKKYNEFIRIFNNAAWNTVMNEIKFSTFLTKSVKEDFLKKFETHSNLSFTKENMLLLFDILFQNRHDIMLNCTVECFDNMTKYYKENRVYIEGWKTNDAWRVNKKVILPRYIQYGFGSSSNEYKRQYGEKFRVNYSYISEIDDIDKIMCYISGHKMDTLPTITFNDRIVPQTLRNCLDKHFNEIGTIKTGDKFENTFESYFFKCKFYKKGTLHITFKDDYVWREFNYLAAKGKGFPLPQKMTK